MIEIRELNEVNLIDFLNLLGTRGNLDYDFYSKKYVNQNFYGGFIAYIDKHPAGCLGFTKREIRINEEKKQIAWFNDWYVQEEFRGNNIGVKLLKSVGEYYGLSCGIITPENSGKIAPKAGFKLNFGLLYECKFPLKPFKIGYNKYYRNGQYSDTIFKRIIRAFVFKLKSNFNIDRCIKFPIMEFKPEYLKDIRDEKQDNSSFLVSDSKFLGFIIDYLKKFSNVKRDFWYINMNKNLLFGFNQSLPNKTTQSVLLYASNLDADNIYQVYSQLIHSLNQTDKRIDQVNILLDFKTRTKFDLSNLFARELPFFTYNLNGQKNHFFYHIDKESSWC